MTAAQLIIELQKCSPDLPVKYLDSQNGYTWEYTEVVRVEELKDDVGDTVVFLRVE